MTRIAYQLILGLCALALAAPATAAADSEPNDGLVQAEGPLQAARDYPGALPTTNERDWYVFYVSGQQQLDIAITNPAGSDDFYAVLRDGDGHGIADGRIFDGEQRHFRYTTPPGTNRFFLELRGGDGVRYTLRIDPAGALVDGPAWGSATATGEPNESLPDALGPLLGGTLYSGAIQTENDEDWFVFHTVGGRAFDVSAVDTVEGGSLRVELLDHRGDHLESIGVDGNTIEHIRRNAPNAMTRYYLKVTGDLDTTYQLRIDPADVLTTKPFEPCARARSAESKLRKTIKSLKSKIKKTNSKKRRSQLRKELKKANKRLAAAAVRTAEACGA